MSLLDRVQRKAEEGQAAHPPALPPLPTLPPDERRDGSHADPPVFRTPDLSTPPLRDADELLPAPTGWQVRHSPNGSEAAPPARLAVAPAPRTPAAPDSRAPAPAPVTAARPGTQPSRALTDAPEAPRPSSLLNRTASSRSPLARPGGGNLYAQLRGKVHQRLVEELAGNTATTPPEQVRARIAELVNELAAEQNLTMTRLDKQRVTETVIADVLGLGPLEGLLADPEITEIMINSPKQIYVEQRGKLTLSPVTFDNNEQLMQVIDRIVSTIGRRVDESSPMVDARLKDGSRVNVIIPPLALRGPTVTIRKFAKEALTVADLVSFDTITEDMVQFLAACVRGRLNIVVSGGTGSGKTTTLNVLSSFIPEEERIVTIEDAAELQLRQEHIVTLETRPANIEGRGRVSIRELVINSLRMRPDRIVIGECRGGEALDMLQAMNTGHDGSMTTVHANNPNDCVSRLETLVLMAGAELPSRAIREQIGQAINIVVQQSRLRDGSRKVTSITEILGTDGERVTLQELFAFRQSGVDEEGKVQGHFTPTGVIPQCMEHLAAQGEGLSESLFQPIRLVSEG